MALPKNYSIVHDFLQNKLSNPQPWTDFVKEWQKNLWREGTEAVQWLRWSLTYYPYDLQLAYHGVWSLILAHLKEEKQDVLKAIIQQCPQLGLSVLL